jgi:translation initiation factor IF-3
MAIPIQNTNKPTNKKQFERIFINDSIKANTIIVTDEDGTSLGTHRRDYALAMAEER